MASPKFPPAPSPILQTGLRLMEERMAAIPAGKTRVGVAYLKGDGTVGVGVAFKIDDRWQFGGELEWKFKQQPELFLGFMYSS